MFEKYSKIKFHDQPFSGSPVVPYGRKDGQTDITKLIFVFRNFWNHALIFYVLPTLCIYVFCVDHRTKNDYFPIQN